MTNSISPSPSSSLHAYREANGQGLNLNDHVYNRFILRIRPGIYGNIGQLRSEIEPLYNAVCHDGVFRSGEDNHIVPDGDFTKISFNSRLWGEVDHNDQTLCVMFDGIEQAKQMKAAILNKTCLSDSHIDWHYVRLNGDNVRQIESANRPCHKPKIGG